MIYDRDLDFYARQLTMSTLQQNNMFYIFSEDSDKNDVTQRQA